MAIFTPRGLKIRLPIDYAFALIARLYPHIDAYKILKTTEGIESISSMFSFISGVIIFYLKLPMIEIALISLIAPIIGYLITSLGLMIPGLIRLGTYYSYISGFGVVLIILALYGFISVGLMGVIIFIIAIILAKILTMFIEMTLVRRLYSRTGFTLTLSERYFINAYRYHAKILGKPDDSEVSEVELEESNWKNVYEDFANKWPAIVGRFTYL